MVEGCQKDWQGVADQLGAREQGLARFAEKLTRTPHKMGPQDLEALRGVGLDDGEILEATHVIGYFNHINRVADALGVDLESWMPAP